MRYIKKSQIIGITLLFIGASIVQAIDFNIVPNSEMENRDEHTLNQSSFESGSWWNDDWHFRKQLDIGDASQDYQMMIQVWMEDGYDDVSNGVIDCEDHCNDDFSDIRFLDDDHTTLLSYWIEENGVGNEDHFANIWVKASGSDTIFMYYGNEEASSESDGVETFVFFDDFEGDDYNHDVWYTYGSAHTWTVSNSIMTMQSTGDPGTPGAQFILKPEASITVPYGYMFYTKLSAFRDSNAWSHSPYVGLYASDVEDTDTMHMWYRGEVNEHMRSYFLLNGIEGGSPNDISSEGWANDAWHYFIMQSDSNAPYASFQVLKEDKTQWGNKVETTLEYYDDFSPFAFYYYQRPYSAGKNTKVDWVFVSKYDYSSQPAWNNFGDEEGTVIEIGETTGGLFKTNVVIKNIGQRDASNVDWSIMLNGGLTIFGIKSTGTIENLPAGDEITINSNLILGFGQTIITISIEETDSSDEKEVDAFMFLFFIIVK